MTVILTISIISLVAQQTKKLSIFPVIITIGIFISLLMILLPSLIQPVVYLVTFPLQVIVFFLGFGQTDKSTLLNVFLIITVILTLAVGATSYFLYKKTQPIILFILLFLFALINLIANIQGFLVMSTSPSFDGLFLQ